MTPKYLPASRSARGFTLLEVLIAVVLSLVLMAGLWALFGTYEALFSHGQAKVENAQLIRALFEQITRDLQSAIPDTSASVPGQSAAVRRFGLFGTQNALQVDVLQVNDAYRTLESTDRNEPREPQRRRNVPELHTVQYLFHDTIGTEAPESGSPSGLVRRELDWETPAGDRHGAGGRGASEGPARTSGRPRLASSSGSSSDYSDPMTLSAGEIDLSDESLLQVPEAVKLQFRYYDGNAWSTQWSSLAQKSLPVAVEVVLVLKRPQESSRPRTAVAGEAPADGTHQAEDASREGELEETLARPSQADTHQHRLLVYLPATSRFPVSAPPPRLLSDSLALPPPSPQAVPSVQPRPAPAPPLQGVPGSGSLRAVLPDQWMRGGT